MTQVKIDDTGDIVTIGRDPDTGAVLLSTADHRVSLRMRNAEATALGHAILDAVDEG